MDGLVLLYECMDDRRRTLAAVALIGGFLILVAVIVGVLVSGKKVLSPLPEDTAIKIIFITPTPTQSPMLTTPTVKPTAKATP